MEMDGLPSRPAFKERVADVPIAVGGLALGVAGVGVAWSLLLPEHAPWFVMTSTPVAAVMVLLVLCKYLLHPKRLHEDLEHTVNSSVLPTLAMAVMVISGNLTTVNLTLARILWGLAVVVHSVILVAFIAYRIKHFVIDHMVPSWFVPPVGIVVASLTGGAMGYPQLSYAIFLFGSVLYAIILPLMLYRLVFHTRITPAQSPTFAVMAAPASLILAAYLTIADTLPEHSPNLVILSCLAPIAMLMTTFVLVAFLRLLRLPFSPGYASFVFPLGVGATALIKLDAYFTSHFASHPVAFLHWLAPTQLIIASAVLCYVLFCYGRHFLFKVSQSA